MKDFFESSPYKPDLDEEAMATDNRQPKDRFADIIKGFVESREEWVRNPVINKNTSNEFYIDEY